MKFESLILFLSCFYFTNGNGNYEFPSAPVIPLPKPIDVLVQPAGHDKGIEEHKGDSIHDSAYKFQEASKSNPIDGSEKVVNEEDSDRIADSQYNLVATEKELIPGFKESSVAEDSKEKEHESYYKFAAYDREIPALYQTYYPAYYPAFPMLHPYANSGYGGIQSGYGGGLQIGNGGYGGGLQSGYGGFVPGVQTINGGGLKIGNRGYGGGLQSGYGGFEPGMQTVYGKYATPYSGYRNSINSLGNSLDNFGNLLGENILGSKTFGGYPNGAHAVQLENDNRGQGSLISIPVNYIGNKSPYSQNGYGDKNIYIPTDPIYPSLSPISSQISTKYNPNYQSNMKKVNFAQSYD